MSMHGRDDPEPHKSLSNQKDGKPIWRYFRIYISAIFSDIEWQDENFASDSFPKKEKVTVNTQSNYLSFVKKKVFKCLRSEQTFLK